MRKTIHEKYISKITPTRLLFVLFMLVGVIARVWALDSNPAGLNQDEAFAAYEAYSLLHYGVDSWGYTMPVYLVTWGSGMSALQSYLMIPFIALFGFNIIAIRMPQVIVGCLTLWAVYLLMKRVLNEKAALFALFFLAISPWHIMMSRWGLDANMAPGFLIFGLYFFVRALENERFFYVSALMYGLSLYCYATIWPLVPIIIVLQLGYGLLYRKIRFSKHLFISGMLIFLLALPLLLFLVVNYGLIEEICLPFISIPKLISMRASDISFDNIIEKMKTLWHIIKFQNDYIPMNATEKYGIFYLCTLPFFVIGLVYYLVKFVRSAICKKTFDMSFFLLVQLGVAGLLGILISVNINRINILFIPMIVIASTGLYALCEFVGRYIGKWIFVVPVLVYSVLFVRFEMYYFTEYKEVLDYHYCARVGEAIQSAIKRAGEIYVCPGIYYTRVLVYSEEPAPRYRDTVTYTNYPAKWLEVDTFDRFHFQFDATSPKEDVTYVLDLSVDWNIFREAGFVLEEYGKYAVAYKP